MSNKILKKLITFIVIFFILRFLFVIGLNYFNVEVSHYIKAINNEVNIDSSMENYLYMVNNVKEVDDSNKTLFIKSHSKKELAILIQDLYFMHEVYINGKLVSQNIDKTKSHFSSDYAYKEFNIKNSDYMNNKIKVEIKGVGTSNTTIFLADNLVMEDSKEIRIINYTIMLMGLFIITLSMFLFYINNISLRYFLILAVIGIVSIIKSINLGELFVVAETFGSSAYVYTFIDNITSLVNTILPTFLMLYLFDIKIKGDYKIIISAVIMLLLSFSVFYDRMIVLNISVFIITVNAIIIAWSFFKDKAFSRVILISSVLYSSLAVYKFMVYNQSYQNGYVGFFTNTAYLGAIIYLSGFVVVFVLKYMKRINELEAKQKEYERIVLLRGIGHDLKLPLSVIKLNNQMLEKYDMVTKENKEYLQTSLGAISELEKMTDNINSYFNIGNFNDEKYTTSIKESFEALKSYYNIYAKDNNQKLIVISDKNDYILHIKPSEFNRMLYNLIDNAVKYSGENGEIRVSYWIDKKIIITVEDSGIGMEKEELDKIFTPFYRVDNSRTKEGLGLGLSVVRGIADSLQGDIDVESKKGVGTKITIHIPKI